MSLINQMLSDLEARRPPQSANSARAMDGLQSVRDESEDDDKMKSSRRFLHAALIGFVVACLAWYGLKWLDGDQVLVSNDQLAHFEQLQPVTVAERVPEKADEEPIESEQRMRPDEAPPIVDVATPEPVAVAYGGTIHMQPRHEHNDRAARLAEAVMLSRHGRIADALIALASLVEDHPDFVSAREVYVHELLRRGDREPAERVLRGGLALNPQEHRYALVLAHVLFERGATDDALKSLLIAAPEVRQDVEYHAFIAALQQRQGRHDAAISAYREVLAAAPDRGVWWMGLAISLAARNHAPQAHSAFQRALVDGDLSDNLRDYAKREISRLSGSS